jgi:hypothetical protein
MSEVFLIPFLSVLSLNMLAILILALLGLLHQQCQRVQGQYISLPLVARSPYVNCWLLQNNSTRNDTSASQTTSSSDLTHVCPFSDSNSTLYL